MPLSKVFAQISLGLLRAFGLHRSTRLLHQMRTRDPRFVDKLIEQLLIDVWPDRVLREGFLRKYLGDHKSRLAARVVIEQSWGEPLIDEIPSETTPAERRLLYMLFRHLWSGDGNVFEIGPFLGGTIRAIVMGMETNPRCRAEAFLYTANQFSLLYQIGFAICNVISSRCTSVAH